ncbi:hypothetical protein [Winogradskyella luteola]|uniref:Transposase n=1 Tax=Winogradskyella luteola TaxID=2828330 RepID=A0A9X1F5F4_9FLAO|nr:hypothetical protein [Winogradskyella luteola]MBV7267736.1 hypothetical protein [Winogradskyella luteola]
MDNKCIDYIIKHKWEKVKTCPLCHERRKFYYFKVTIKCAKCRKIFSIRKNTIFENSKVPLVKWFKAIEYVTESEEGNNSVKLSKHIKVTQKTAYFMLRKMKRFGVVNPRLTRKIQRQNNKILSELIRNKILSTIISMSGKPKISYKDLPKDRKEFYERLKEKIRIGEETMRKRKTAYEAAIIRAIK